MYGIIELILLYVLSAIATFLFLYYWAKDHDRFFDLFYSIVASVLWPFFFVYQLVRRFPR